MAKTILLVDDETDMLFVLGEAFKRHGFDVCTASNGKAGLEKYFETGPDLVIADISMPEMNGIEMVRTIRMTDKHTPIFMLTGMVSVKSAISGFEAGVNDYIRKPFSVDEVIARAKAVIEFFDTNTSDVVRIGQFEFRASGHTLQLGDETILLPGMESSILELLSNNMNQVVKTCDILKCLGKNEDFYSRRCLSVHIVKLRKILSKDPDVSVVVERLAGYRLVG